MHYGLQLYSVRDITETDFEGALRQVAEMGYRMVEPAGFFGHSAEDVAQMLAKYGLTVCSTHTPIWDLFDDPAGIIEYHKTIGCRDIILPALTSRIPLDEIIQRINEIQPMVEAAGMRLHFHNHWGEFLPNAAGEIVMDELASRTRIFFQIDIFWAFNAGKDPLQVMEQYRDRITTIHLKDGFAQDHADPASHAVGTSLGMGQAPVEAVRKKALEMGLNIVVESEGLDPTGPEEVKRCIVYLQSLDAKDGI